MSADTRIWSRPQWETYFRAETNRLGAEYKFFRLSTTEFYAEHERLGEELRSYVYSRMRMWKRGQVDRLEF